MLGLSEVPLSTHPRGPRGPLCSASDPPTGRMAWGAAEGGGATTPALRARPDAPAQSPSGRSPARDPARRPGRARAGGPPGVARLPISPTPGWERLSLGQTRRVLIAAQLVASISERPLLPPLCQTFGVRCLAWDAVRRGGVPFRSPERVGQGSATRTYPGSQCC